MFVHSMTRAEHKLIKNWDIISVPHCHSLIREARINPREVHVEFLIKRVAVQNVFPCEYSDFPCQSSFHQCLITAAVSSQNQSIQLPSCHRFLSLHFPS